MDRYDKEIRIRPTREIDQRLIAKINAEAEKHYMSTTQFVKLILAKNLMESDENENDE